MKGCTSVQSPYRILLIICTDLFSVKQGHLFLAPMPAACIPFLSYRLVFRLSCCLQILVAHLSLTCLSPHCREHPFEPLSENSAKKEIPQIQHLRDFFVLIKQYPGRSSHLRLSRSLQYLRLQHNFLLCHISWLHHPGCGRC